MTAFNDKPPAIGLPDSPSEASILLHETIPIRVSSSDDLGLARIQLCMVILGGKKESSPIVLFDEKLSEPSLQSAFTLPFDPDFFNLEDLARITQVSKCFYSDIIVRLRHMGVQRTIGASNASIKDDLPVNQLFITCNNIDNIKELCKLDRRDELALYFSVIQLDLKRAITSISFPPSFQDPGGGTRNCTTMQQSIQSKNGASK